MLLHKKKCQFWIISSSKCMSLRLLYIINRYSLTSVYMFKKTLKTSDHVNVYGLVECKRDANHASVNRMASIKSRTGDCTYNYNTGLIQLLLDFQQLISFRRVLMMQTERILMIP